MNTVNQIYYKKHKLYKTCINLLREIFRVSRCIVREGFKLLVRFATPLGGQLSYFKPLIWNLPTSVWDEPKITQKQKADTLRTEVSSSDYLLLIG